MVEYDRTSQQEDPARPALRTCIVGVGGAGSNVLDRITLDRTVDADLICVHTDVRVLSHAMAPSKIQLGTELMRGVGAGGDPDLGREAALYSREEIRHAVDGHDIVVVCAGLGGGTGSGAAPVIAEIAKSTRALVLVTATMPFSFEGRRRLAQAEEALELLQKRADALILFENNRMGELILPKDGIQKAFSMADQLIAQSLRAVSTMITTPGLVKLGLDDLTSALSSSNGRCLFGFGEARGQNRGNEALKRALKSPLIDSGRLLHQAATLLVHIAGGESLTLVEVEGVMKQLGRHVPDRTHILFGVAVDPKLGESLTVTLISSLGLAQLNAQASAAPPAEMLRPSKEKAPDESEVTKPTAEEPETAPTPKASVAEEAMDLLFTAEEITPSAQAEDPAPASTPELPAALEEEAIIDIEEAPLPHVAATVQQPEPQEEEPAPAPAPKPVMEEVVQTSLAAVVARTTVVARDVPKAEAPYAPPQPGASTRKPSAPGDEQQAFRFGEEDRGRFKDTEPALVQGEDLDVPTWMRLKRKLKR